jgi:hypothetical protein
MGECNGGFRVFLVMSPIEGSVGCINNCICPIGGAGGGNAAAGAPAPENFTIQTSHGVPAAVTAIVPYTPQPDLYLVQVRAPCS